LEEERISFIYLNLWKRRFAGLWKRTFPRGFWRSPLLPGVVLAALILTPTIIWVLHRQGRFHRVRNELRSEIQGENYSNANKPGGVDPIVLTRTASKGGGPEFLSTTLLPGLGMGVLQITANLPGRGESPLLAAPTMDAIVQGTVGPPSGVNDDHGALEVPWGGVLMGAPTPVGTSITVNWQDHSLEIPTDMGGPAGTAEGGLLATQGPDESQHSAAGAVPATATALFKNLTFDDHWLQKTDVSVSAAMNARTIELTVQAKNVGDGPEPMGVGWHPRFLVVRGPREHVEIQLPGGELMGEGDDRKPTGKAAPDNSSAARFEGHPSQLEALSLDDTIANPKAAPGQNGAAVEMLDPEAGYGLRMTAESASIKSVRVTSPSDAGYVAVGMQTNTDDPFGKEWVGADGVDHSGVVILQPGETLVWKVRLEIFPVGK
jgi:aldose 1-epimerase